MFLSQIFGFVYNSSFYSYSLILILWEADLTRDLIISVFQHYDQVIATLLLSITLLYWFAIITFNSDFKGDYKFEDHFVIKIIKIYFFFFQNKNLII